MAQVPPQEMANYGMPKGSFWRGQDGQVYVYGDQGTNAAGIWGDQTSDYWNNQGYTQIVDPYLETVSSTSTYNAPSNPTGASGTTYKDTSASRDATQASLDALGGVRLNKREDENVSYRNLIGEYDTEFASEKGKYDRGVGNNEQALSTGSQAAMLAAAQGGRGLRATLAAMGALGGTGSLLADRAITDSANKDLGGARDNFETNAETLQTAWGDFEDADKKRRKTAGTVRDTNKQAVDADIFSQKQKLLQDMASFWEQAGNTANYDKYMAQATALTPQIAASSAPRQAYKAEEASFSPAEMQKYLAGNRDMTVGRQAGAQSQALNNPLYAFSGNTKKEEELV